MLYADGFEETFNFDGYQNNKYDWNFTPDRYTGSSENRGDGLQLDIVFDGFNSRDRQRNWSRSADEILLFKNDDIDLSACRITPADAEKITDFDILTGEATPDCPEVKTAAAPDLTGRGRPKRQTEASSNFAEPAPPSTPAERE